jgi:hypothetical protein
MVARKFHKFLRFNKGGSKTPFVDLLKGDSQGATQRKKKVRPKKDKNTQDIQCFECSGYGRNQTQCANLKYSKGQAMNASLSNESKASKKKNVSHMAFTALRGC